MKININIIVITCLAMINMSCDKFLGENPSKTSSLVPTTVEHLDFILNSYNSFCLEGNRTAIYSTDDYGLDIGLDNAKNSIYGIAGVQFATWDIENLPFDGREGFWSGEYRKIFTANMVLEYLGKVSGDENRKAILKAESHFIRAYSLFQLVNTYCLPYNDANKNEMGLVLKASVSFEESVERATLEETYKQIEIDLAEALKIQESLKVVNNKNKSWRASKPAVNAFAARYWLSRNNYAKAIQYADLALQGHSQLMDYNSDMRYSAKDYPVTINAGTPTQQTVVVKFPYTYDNQSDPSDMMGWKEFYYFRLLSHEAWWYIPSQDLINLYDKTNDLRYKYHMIEEYSYIQGSTIKPAYKYPGYIFFFKDRIPSGPTVAEMLLVKAEALARTDKVTEAMSTVNLLRAKRISNSAGDAAIKLTAGSKQEAVTKILQERRREMPFSQRWFDIRRFNINEDSNDDVELTKNYYPYNTSAILRTEPLKLYTLKKNSRRFAAPIPYNDLQSSNGVIVQNKY